MITDRRPARDTLRREYDSSHRLEKIRAPACANLAPLFGALEAVRDAAAPELMKNICTRTHRLYLAAIGHPYYPLKWRRVGFEGRQIVDWQETKRLGAKVLDRTKVRDTRPAGRPLAGRPRVTDVLVRIFSSSLFSNNGVGV
jgi:hypothetical protein